MPFDHLVDRWPEDNYHVALYWDGDQDAPAYRLYVERDGVKRHDVTTDVEAAFRRIHQLVNERTERAAKRSA